MRGAWFLWLAWCATARAEAPAAPAPVASWPAPSSGFIDDSYGLRADGKAIAFIVTDGAAPGTLHMVEVGGAAHELPGVPTAATRLHWLGLERILVVTGGERVSGVVYGKKGATREKLGPADAIALGTVSGRPAVVAFAKHGPEYNVTAYEQASWRALGRKSLRIDAEGRIVHPGGPFRPLWWGAGHTEVAALKAGEFDKARDLRRPERFARLDVFTSKLRDEHELEDLMAFARLSAAHAAHPGEEVFARLSEDHHQLLVTDGLSETAIELSRPLHHYDADSIAYQLLDDGNLALSMTIDPVNPDALQRKKSEPDDLEIYLFDRRAHAARLALKLPGQGRPSSWRIAGGRVAVLRKSKGFDRGGVTLELYDLQSK